MVGIPGKSLGCHNCRRRKIKCDLAKPYCERCTKTGRTCEGYARETIFRNKTVTGSGASQSNVSRSITPTADLIPAQIGPNPALRYKIEGIFLEHHLPIYRDNEWSSTGMYLIPALRELPRDWILEPAIQAVCMTRVGRLQLDMRMLRLGHQAYGLALRKLIIALSKPETMNSVSAIAASKILNLYEHYEPSDNSVNGLYDHISGMTNLIALRGHAQHNSDATRMLLETSRYNSMVNAIVGWQHSPLSKVQWRTVSWDTPADFEQRLYDVGYTLAGIMDDLHLLAMQETISSNDAARASLAGKWLAARQDLSTWYSKLVAFAPTPLFRQAAKGRFEYIVYDGRSFEFDHLLLAHMLMDYWALRIFSNMVLEAVHSSIWERKDGVSPKLAEIRALNTAMENVSVLEQFDLARHIEASVNYCCQSTMGWAGPQKTLFPLRVALVLYRRTPGLVSKTKKGELREIMRKLPERTGLFIADPLAKRWSAPWALSKHFEHVPGDQTRPDSESSTDSIPVRTAVQVA